jgi:hypothetical protein
MIKKFGIAYIVEEQCVRLAKPVGSLIADDIYSHGANYQAAIADQQFSVPQILVVFFPFLISINF